MTRNSDINKYGYTGYRIVFDTKTSFLSSSDGFGENVMIFGVDMSSSVHNKKKDILILGNGLTQGLEYTITAEKKYSINFTGQKKHSC